MLIKRRDGVMICGICGDLLIRTKIIKPSRIFALITALAFATPILLMIVQLIEERALPTNRSPEIPIAFISESKNEFLGIDS